MAARLPLRRAAARRRARAARRPGASTSSRSSRSRSSALGRAERRPLFLIAESDLNDPKLIRPREAGGYGLDAQWCDDVHHALWATLSGERQGYYVDFGPLPVLAKALNQGFVHDGGWSTFRGRRHGRPPAGVPAPQFVTYLQDHDQIGNRAVGDRASATLSDGLLQVGAALLLLSPVHPDAVHGRGVGRPHAVAVLLRPRRRARRGRAARAGAGSSPSTAGRPTRSPIRRTRRRSRRRSSTGTSRDQPRAQRCWSGTAADRAAARRAGARPSSSSAGPASTTTSSARWFVAWRGIRRRASPSPSTSPTEPQDVPVAGELLLRSAASRDRRRGRLLAARRIGRGGARELIGPGRASSGSAVQR